MTEMNLALFLFLRMEPPLSRSKLVSHLQAALRQAGTPTEGCTGHSFRIGAATTAAQAGLSDSMIQQLGRWKSAVFASYIRPPVEKLASASSSLVQPWLLLSQATDNPPLLFSESLLLL